MPETLVARHPLEGIPTGTSDDTLTALLFRRDTLDKQVIALAQTKRDVHQEIVDLARYPGGSRLPAFGSAGSRGGMADRFREEVKTEMAAWRLAEQEQRVTLQLKVAIDEREAVCTELGARLRPLDARRCTA
ncbi:MAG: hypothetical protein HY275_11645 [Gemmatimonadetes bacterium]|nr:hypothetical protein [Gemmatimonadota bacterium]